MYGTSNPLSCNYWFGQNLKLVVVRYGARQYEPTWKFIHVYISSLHTSLLTFASNRCRFIMFVHVPKVHIARPCIEQFHIIGPTQDLTQASGFIATRTALARPADAHGMLGGHRRGDILARVSLPGPDRSQAWQPEGPTRGYASKAKRKVRMQHLRHPMRAD